MQSFYKYFGGLYWRLTGSYFLATLLAQVEDPQGGTRILRRVHWHRTLQVGQREVAFAVSTVCGAEQREERGVLTDGQELTIAESPALRRKTEWKDANFS